jgi:hypothetical protein
MPRRRAMGADPRSTIHLPMTNVVVVTVECSGEETARDTAAWLEGFAPYVQARPGVRAVKVELGPAAPPIAS